MKQLSATKPLHLILATLLLLLSLNSTATEVITYYHNDALGSPVAATDEQGNVLWREEYEPYGKRITVENASKENEQFYTGKQEEPELGLQYFGARWYDPDIGRFISMDPVGFQEGNIHSFNRYAYANNNPYLFVDPDGNVPIPLIVYAAYKGISVAVDTATIAADVYAGNYAGAAITAAGMADPTGVTNKLRKAQQAATLAKTTKNTVRFKRWSKGDAIDKPLSDGSAPSWATVRSRYWKNRAHLSNGEFSSRNLKRMKRGAAPLDYNPATGKMESRELHHVVGRRNGGSNSPMNLREMTPGQHGAVDPFRNNGPTNGATL